VVIAGTGVISSPGQDVAAFCAGLCAGEVAARRTRVG
jgi:hypothetical protein